MKRKLAAAIIALGVSVGVITCAHAQGRVFFNNYGGSGASSTFAPITYTPGGPGLNNSFTAGLWYFLGTTTLSATPGNDILPAGWELASVTQQINSGATAGPAGAGFFVGPIAQIPDYVSGPITFAVTAYNGSSYNTSISRAHSSGFTLPGIATGLSATGYFGPGLQGFALVPEPSIVALSGLGAAVVLLIRRKK